MAQSIEYYTAEAAKSYDNSKKALQNQINAISGNLAQTQKQINENYAQQQNTLYNQRNQAASNASMQAAGSGGSFGGAANIANKKYYEQTFVPAQTQLNTNQSQALENAQSQANSNRLSLEGQLASLNDEISKAGLARYYQALDNEREDAYRKQQLALQRQQIAVQNAANRYLQSQAQGNGGSSAMEWDFGNGYKVYGTKGGQAVYTKDGQKITAGEFLYAIPTKQKGIQWNKWNDIWKQGVSTKGVGSDTINAFKSNDYNKMMNLAQSNQYSYLFR